MKQTLSTFILVVTTVASVYSQEELSLSDAVALGLEHNYGIQVERKNVAIAGNSNAWGETGLLPTVSLNFQGRRNWQNQESDNQFFGGRLFDGFELNNQKSFNLTPSAQVSWTIFQGNKAILTKRRLEQLEAESMQNADVVVANTLQAIILAYYLAVLEKDRLMEFEKQMRLSGDRFEYMKTKFDLGGVVSSELLLEENNYLIDSTNYINQELVYHNANRNLNQLLVVDDLNKEYLLTDSLYDEGTDYRYGPLEDEMFSENVDLNKIYLSQSILETEVKRSQSDLYPTLSVNGGYQWNRSVSDLTDARYEGSNEYEKPPSPLVSKTGNYYAGFTLAFNLYNGGRVKRAIRNSIIREDIGNLRIEDLKVTLRKDLMQAYERYQIRKRLYGIAVRIEESASKNLQISQEKFKNGSINSFDFRVVQNNYLSASIQKLQSLYNLQDSKVELMRLTGGLVKGAYQ